MKIMLRSKVNGELIAIYNRFDQDLFRHLLPPGAQLIEFGGSKKGDVVRLKLPIAGEWVSEITEDEATDDMCYFIDEGTKLPFPLKTWKHKHILHREANSTIIEDDIYFSTGYFITDIILYPFLFLSFLPRSWQYKDYFNT